MINLEMLAQKGIIRYDQNSGIESIRQMLKKFALSADVDVDIYSYFKDIHDTYNVPDYCRVMGINEPFYSKLNNKMVKLLHNGKDTCKVASTENLKLPYKYKATLQGCRYETYSDTQDGRRIFVYWLPKKYVYRQNLCALAISKGIKPKKYHYLVKLLCIDGDYIYLHLVTFSKRVEYSKKIVAIYPSLERGQKKIAEVINYFNETGIIVSTSDYVEREEGEPFCTFNPQPLEHDSNELINSAISWL